MADYKDIDATTPGTTDTATSDAKALGSTTVAAYVQCSLDRQSGSGTDDIVQFAVLESYDGTTFGTETAAPLLAKLDAADDDPNVSALIPVAPCNSLKIIADGITEGISGTLRCAAYLTEVSATGVKTTSIIQWT